MYPGCRTLGDVPGLIAPDQRFRDDDGSAQPRLAAALSAYAAGQETEHAVLTALARTRLLVPVVAAVNETMVTGARDDRVLRHEKTSEMALPTLAGRDGRRAIIAFTSLDALARWRKDARPLPAWTDHVCQAAVAESMPAVVVDVAGPVVLVLEGARLAALAAGRPVPRPVEDSDVRASVDALVAADPDIAAAGLAVGSAGTDLTVRLVLAARPGATAAAPEVTARRAATAIMTALGGRFRRGIEIAIVPALDGRGRRQRRRSGRGARSG